jgi:four helix bundle protein
MQDFRKHAVWQAARRVTSSIYKLSAGFPDGETFGSQMQLRRASVSICSNIAEGCGRRSSRDFRRFLDHAMGSACELECELIIAGDLGLVIAATQGETLSALEEVKRMLAGLMGKVVPPRPRTDTRTDN